MRTASVMVLLGAMLVSACAADEHASHAEPTAQSPAAAAPATQAGPAAFDYPRVEALPPGADRAQAAIDRLPRHGEWVEVASPAARPSRPGSSIPSAATRRQWFS
jgi:hypothetical protein